MEKIFCVILAGGSGERLWPLSRHDRPKQFLKLNAQYTLLEQTVKRMRRLVPKERLCIVTTQYQLDHMTDEMRSAVEHIIAEPIPRNTAGATLLACLAIAQHTPDALICVLPADHFIPDEELFIRTVEYACKQALLSSNIMLIGVKPRYASHAYGYIEADGMNESSDNDQLHWYPVNRFHEKPPLDTARVYNSLSNMLWNSGVSVAPLEVWLHEYATHAPAMSAAVSNYIEQGSSYELVDDISLDYAILEKSTRTGVVPGTFFWSDVGNLETFLMLANQQETNQSHVIDIKAHENIVYAREKLVALIGVDNLCIVETDDVLLIARRGQTDQVKQIVGQLKRKSHEEYL